MSITLEADFCIEAVEEALARHGTPEIFNTDSHTIDASSRMVDSNTDRPFAGLVPQGFPV